MRRAIRRGEGTPDTISLIVVYSLAKALGISPLDIYQMPASLVLSLLEVHSIFEEIKAEEIKKKSKN